MMLGKRLMIILSSLTGAILVTLYAGYMFKVLPSFTTIFNMIRRGDAMVG